MPQKAEDKLRHPQQYGALCWREKGLKVEVLLVTSRGTGRWVIPKGWPMKGKTVTEAVAQEAWEEAGVKGTVHPVPIGSYRYTKPGLDPSGPEIEVTVFHLLVQNTERKFPERKDRRRRWVSPQKAAQLVAEADLAKLILAFPSP